VIGALAAILFRISLRWIGMIMAFGAGVLISAVAFDLVQEAANTAPANRPIFVGIFVGSRREADRRGDRRLQQLGHPAAKGAGYGPLWLMTPRCSRS
jgi:zinc transporter, ZIP family